jgi:hypothetical protein
MDAPQGFDGGTENDVGLQPDAASCSLMQPGARSKSTSTDAGLTRSKRSNTKAPTSAKTRVRSGP